MHVKRKLTPRFVLRGTRGVTATNKVQIGVGSLRVSRDREHAFLDDIRGSNWEHHNNKIPLNIGSTDE